MADGMIAIVGGIGPIGVLGGLFLVTAAITQLMSNTAAALVMLPIAAASGPELGVSPMPMIIAVAMGAHGALLTPVATPVNLMVMGPGGYRFSEYWKFGLPILAWWFVVAVVVVPLYWRFGAARRRGRNSRHNRRTAGRLPTAASDETNAAPAPRRRGGVDPVEMSGHHRH